jgi:dihydrofolate synthase/folylpolyglutamate synthase
MNYSQALSYLESFINYEKKSDYSYTQSFKPRRMRSFLEAAGAPDRGLRVIHVAGTKGKGSVCVLAANILRCHGYRVGLYTSPHLSDIRERIRVIDAQRKPDGFDAFEGMISAREFAACCKELRGAVEAFHARRANGRLSFFEVYTALAFLYFRKRNVDFAVLETGLGGRLDATNAVDSVAAGITAISYDHVDKLGCSLSSIAREKCGIIKPSKSGFPEVVCAPQAPAVTAAIKGYCRQLGVKPVFVDSKRIKCLGTRGRYQTVSFLPPHGVRQNIRTRLWGDHQAENIAVAWQVVSSALCRLGRRFDPARARRGISEAIWPGRFEVAALRPAIVLDGAHNEASSAALKRALEKIFPGKKPVFVIGMSSDKDIVGVCRELVPRASCVVVTQARSPRAASCEQILSISARFSTACTWKIQRDVGAAVRFAVREAGPRGVVVVTGSLFVVGEARNGFIPRQARQKR